MGFFSSITGGSKTKVPATGFYALPANVQNAYNGNVAAAAGWVSDPSIYAPSAFTNDQQTAFGNIEDAANPTSQSILDMVAKYQNPYDESIINDINKQATGQNSILNQTISANGTMGSNRQLLGANDIDMSRLNQINTFEQGQFNNSLNTGLQQQQQNNSNLLAIGGQQQQQNTGVQQAPLLAREGLATALQQYLVPFANGGNGSSQAATVKTSGGLGGILGGIGTAGGITSGLGGLATAAGYAGTGSTLGSIGGALAMFSDERVKENMIPAGVENGHQMYEFNYKGDKTRFVGVKAQEVQTTHPEAVSSDPNGILKVDYAKIGVKMRRV